MDIVKELDNSSSLAEAFFKIAGARPDSIVYSQALLKEPDSRRPPEDQERSCVKRSFKTVSERIKKIAGYLISIGVKPGDKVAIISSSRCEWMEADIAAIAAGAVTVSVYHSLTPADIGYILFDSQAKVVFAENEEQLKKLKSICESEFSIPAVENRPQQKVKLSLQKIITFEKVSEHYLDVSLEEILSGAVAGSELAYFKLSRDDLASLVYTSGTTGPPKGVEQTHGNHLANVRQAFQCGIYREDSVIMIVLPLAHSFAKLMGYICFLTPAVATFPAVADRKSSKLNAESITKDINLCGASLFPLVPRMLEKMKEGVEKKAAGTGPLAALLSMALKSAKQVGRARRSGVRSDTLSAVQFLLTKPLRQAIKKKLFGSNFHYIISGGAKLSVEVAQFFDDIEVEVLEGYGLTETCVATNVNRYGKKKIGTVGPVLTKDIELTLSEEGEILFRGPNISRGYYNRPEATKAAWDSDGRFHTGDLGSIDNEGYLTITGRKKELIVTAGGKKIPPDAIESKLKTLKYVSQAVLVGEGKPYCAALVTANSSEAFRDLGLNPAAPESWKALEDHINAELPKLNSTLASFETVKKISLLREDFTIENGLLTPTFKVKRNEVYKRYAQKIEELYSGK